MPSRRAPGGRGASPDARALMALLLVTLVLAALLAFEAEQEVGAHRVATARVLREHLQATARDALGATAAALRAALRDALGPAVEPRAASPYEALPSAQLLAAHRPNALFCGDPSPAWLRLDLRDGAVETTGKLDPAVARWTADTLRALLRGAARPLDDGGDATYAVLRGAGPATGRAIAWGVKRAPFDAPIAVYALVTCDAALGAPLVTAAAAGGAGGDALAVALADSLLAVQVRADAGPVAGRVVAERRVAGLRLLALEGPAAGHRLVVPERPRTRLLAVGVLATITGALVLVSLLQLRREQELVRTRADFTSSVSHELRTPLAQILLYGEPLALGRVRDDAERRRAADAIVREARRLVQMVDNVLHVSRAERRATALRPTDVVLAPLVRDVVDGFAPLAGTARLTCDVPDALAARATPDALRQILLNLLDNAVRYGPPGQTVRVGAAPDPFAGLVRLWVEDEGPGIPPRDRGRVWAPFVRLARDRAAAGPTGSGLGLAVVADLVRQLGGSVAIEDASGGGTRVLVRLAAAEVAAPVLVEVG